MNACACRVRAGVMPVLRGLQPPLTMNVSGLFIFNFGRKTLFALICSYFVLIFPFLCCFYQFMSVFTMHYSRAVFLRKSLKYLCIMAGIETAR